MGMKRARRAVSDDWGSFDDYIVCPYCNEEDHEFTDYPDELRRDGDETTYECSYCDKVFDVTVSISYNYATRPREGVTDE